MALVARIVFLSTVSFFIDDAYITFRYARNIISGLGFVYNTGQPVYGASSPLHVLIAALVDALLPESVLPQVMAWIGCLGLIGFVLAVWKVLPADGISRTITAMLLLSYPRVFYSSIGGMEECVILFLMGLTVLAALRRSQLWCGIICGILFVAKIDSAAWIACLMVAATLQDKSFPWRAAAWALLVALPWIIFSLFYFGSPLPHTIEAKRIAYAAMSSFSLLDAVKLTVPDAFKSNPWIVAIFGIFTYGTIALAIWRVIQKREWIYLAFPLYCVVYTLALFVSGVSAGLWTRWTVPLWGALIVSFGYALPMIINRIRFLNELTVTPAITWGSLLVYCLLLATPLVYENRRYLEVTSFRDVGIWLRDHASHSDSVILEPIGLVGFLSGMRIHDFIGLVTPGVTDARSSSGLSNRWFARYLHEAEPTFIVLRDLEVQRNEFLYGGYGDKVFTPEERKWFDSNYRETFRTTTGPDVDRLVLFRKLLQQ